MPGTTHLSAGAEPLDPAAPEVSTVLALSSRPDDDPTPVPVRLLGSADRPLVYVALTPTDLTRLDRWLATPDPDADVRVVDATPGRSRDLDVPTTDVASPATLTDLGVAVTRAFSAAGPDATCSFRSLTALYQYVDRSRAYRFVNAVLDRAKADAVLACVVVDPEALPDRDVDVFASLFDTVYDPRGAE